MAMPDIVKTSRKRVSNTEKRPNVKDLIRGLLTERGTLSSADVQRAAGITRQAAHHHLRSLVEAGEIQHVGKGRGARYQLPRQQTIRRSLQDVEEHLLWNEVLQADKRLREAPQNVVAILRFAFTEMVNNAIDHSQGRLVDVSSVWMNGRILFHVTDDGVGAFQTVRTKFALPDNFAALQEISKGKTTTDPEHHSGEGIFFTSKAVDRFMLEANGLRWTVDNITEDQAAGDAPSTHGTRVSWSLDSGSRRQLSEVFAAFTDPETYDFNRSQAVVRLFESGASFVSRSEARRLAHGLEKFQEVTVDFRGISDVGQGFIDELFRVWAGAHQRTRLVPTNMSPAVEAMVRRGLPRDE